MHKIGVN